MVLVTEPYAANVFQKSNKIKCPVSGHRLASKSVRWRAVFVFDCFLCGNLFILYLFICIYLILLTSEIHNTLYTWLLEPDQISHTQIMVAERGLTNRSYPYCEKDV